ARAATRRIRREVLGFYYGWYANPAISDRYIHWTGPTGKEAPDEKPPLNTPLLGLYDSHDPAVVRQHVAWARQAGLTGLISGAWARDARTDESTRLLVAELAAARMKASVYIEGQKNGYDGAVADLRQLLTTHAKSAAWLRVGNRPVIFFYQASLRALAPAEWRRAAKQIAAEGFPEPILIGDVDPRLPTYDMLAAPLDGTHIYVNTRDLAGKSPVEMLAYAKVNYPQWRAKSAGKMIQCATVSPGYNDTKTPITPARNYPRYIVHRYGTAMLAAQWQAAVGTDPDWVLLTSFNAWNDGAELEPSREWGTLTIDANRPLAEAFLRRG
ncbi:hypothetical protein, partial [Sphingomonas bacterium]|uniref:hypothetical protein n=1 Tax=Sphingomonas bacterium TaxID=1895847 RepID=UPI00157702A9